MIDTKTLHTVTPEEFTSGVFSMRKTNQLSEKWPQLNAPFVREIITDFYHFVLDNGTDFDVVEGRKFKEFAEKISPRIKALGIPARYTRTILDSILDDARLEISRLARTQEMLLVHEQV